MRPDKFTQVFKDLALEYENFYLASRAQSLFLHTSEDDSERPLKYNIISVANFLVNNTRDSTGEELEQLRQEFILDQYPILTELIELSKTIEFKDGTKSGDDFVYKQLIVAPIYLSLDD